MKAFIKTLLIFVIAGTSAYSANRLFMSPCSEPIEYRIGEWSDKFGISRGDFLIAMHEAESVWEEALGKDLLVYSADKGMAVNLIYDYRQETADRNKILETRIDQTQGTALTVRENFEALKSRYESESRAYDAMIERFKSDERVYNEQVAYWNSQNGAPKKEYEELQRMKAELEEYYRGIERQRTLINGLAKDVNDLVGKYNYLVQDVNSKIEVINESADKEFEQGEYTAEGDSQEIAIYGFNSRKELIHVLAHEFGHALGLEHNENPRSIMYYLNEDLDNTPSKEDVRDLKLACKIK